MISLYIIIYLYNNNIYDIGNTVEKIRNPFLAGESRHCWGKSCTETSFYACALYIVTVHRVADIYFFQRYIRCTIYKSGSIYREKNQVWETNLMMQRLYGAHRAKYNVKIHTTVYNAETEYNIIICIYRFKLQSSAKLAIHLYIMSVSHSAECLSPRPSVHLYQ